MNIVIWARVSSREQREGYSIDAQLRACRAKAEREGWTVVREFVVAESAKRGAERTTFNEMYDWVRRNARRESIGAILSHKLDRVCRNMRDAIRMQELEDKAGVKLSFVDNEFGPGAAGTLSFNVMAAVSQYYSDNLRSEVLKGKNEKVRQGWLPSSAPYGYVNVSDRDEPIKPHPRQARAVIRIFELYSRGDMTFERLAEVLQREGHVYRPSQPRFHRTALSYILNNRFYIGEITWHGESYPGKHRPLVDRATFERCQTILHGRNRRTGKPEFPLAGGLFTCAHCGSLITGERIRRRLRSGGIREHIYYRCANNNPGPDHPRVRWRAADLEQAIVADLATMRLPSPEIADWFRHALREAFADITAQQRRQRQALLKRQTELTNMRDRLLTAYLAGSVDERTFQNKSTDLEGQLRQVEQALERYAEVDTERGWIGQTARDASARAPRATTPEPGCRTIEGTSRGAIEVPSGCHEVPRGNGQAARRRPPGHACGAMDGPFGATTSARGATASPCGAKDKARGAIPRSRGEIALAVFDWSQEAAEMWQRSKIAQKRAILEALSLNRVLSATSLCVQKRKPFDILAERPSVQLDRGERI